MNIVLFEINQIYSLGYKHNYDNTQKKYLTSILKGPFESHYSTVITDVFIREFPICDVFGDNLGNPCFFRKRESPSLKPLF